MHTRGKHLLAIFSNILKQKNKKKTSKKTFLNNDCSADATRPLESRTLNFSKLEMQKLKELEQNRRLPLFSRDTSPNKALNNIHAILFEIISFY